MPERTRPIRDLEERKRLGLILKRLREDRGWTQKRFAQLLQVSVRTVGSWESGQNGYPAECWKRISTVLDVSVIQLTIET